jgi:DNA-directed RNA polymerase subunit RPC12/RpoP
MSELLDDLENFVNGDWKVIYKEYEAEEYRKEISEPVIPDIPSYEEFYKLLVLLIGTRDTPPELDYFINKIIYFQDMKLTKSFEKVWSMFCNPHEYRTISHSCSNCKKSLSVTTQREGRLSIWSERGQNMNTIVHKSEEVHCPSCGYCFLVTTGEVVGIFSN